MEIFAFDEHVCNVVFGAVKMLQQYHTKTHDTLKEPFIYTIYLYMLAPVC